MLGLPSGAPVPCRQLEGGRPVPLLGAQDHREHQCWRVAGVWDPKQPGAWSVAGGMGADIEGKQGSRFPEAGRPVQRIQGLALGDRAVGPSLCRDMEEPRKGPSGLGCRS